MPSDAGLRHAKVFCTLGPASDHVKAIGALIDAGTNHARGERWSRTATGS